EPAGRDRSKDVAAYLSVCRPVQRCENAGHMGGVGMLQRKNFGLDFGTLAEFLNVFNQLDDSVDVIRVGTPDDNDAQLLECLGANRTAWQIGLVLRRRLFLKADELNGI